MKKITKKIFALVMILSIVLTHFLPIMNVSANDEYFIKMNIANELGFTIDSVTINGSNWASNEDEFHTNDDQYHIEIRISSNETTGDIVPKIQYGGNWNDYITPASFHENGKHTFILDINNGEHQTFLGLEILEQEEQNPPQPDPGSQDPNPENPNPGENEPVNEPHFDGKAYLLWSCSNGGICMYHFDNIPDYDDGNSTFYKASDIIDARTGEKFNIDAKYRGFSTDERFDAWVSAYKTYKNVSEINWADVDPKDMIGEPVDMRQYEDKAIAAGTCTKDNTPQDVFQGCVDNYAASTGVWVSRAQLQPVGEPDANNAYVSYGDRNFKVVIYNDNYKGIAIGDLSELEYYPDYYTNPFIRRDQYDISGTSKDKPTGIDTILLEKVIRIKALNYNGFDIEKIEALDVPSDAVTITKVDGEWRLEFSSNFYDMVVFKVTDTKGGESYIQIKRTTIDGWIKNEDNKPVINADFWFDKEKSYEDFVLTAKIYYKDGTTKKVTLSAVKSIDDGLGNIAKEFEVLDGKGLKKSCFQYKLDDGEDKQIKTIYFNAEYKGSTTSNYAGAYVGSGEGVKANLYQEEE